MFAHRPPLPLRTGSGRPGRQPVVQCTHAAEKGTLTPRQKRIAEKQRRWQQEQAEKKKDAGMQASTSATESSSTRAHPERARPKRTSVAGTRAPESMNPHPPSTSQPLPSRQQPAAALQPQLIRSRRSDMGDVESWSLWTQPKHGGSIMAQLRSMTHARLSHLSRTWAEEWVEMERLGRTTLPQTAVLNVEALVSCIQERLQPAAGSGDNEDDDASQEPGSRTAPGAGFHSHSFHQQDLADLSWALRHFNLPTARDQAAQLEQAMRVPFTVLPNKLQHLNLEALLAEVELRQDEIHLEDRVILESRRTAWQSDIGATFIYSGKEMVPAGQRMTPEVAKVRDQLVSITGESFDSVLINYYEDGRCGMRFHVDPLYDCWTPNSAVVSVGQTRRFTFREIEDYKSRWDYSVRNGDVVFMFGDCQERLQHSIKVEREDRGAAEMGPRMSLVFKQRIKDEHGWKP